MRRFGKARMRKNNIQSSASWTNMTNPAGCWAQSAKWYCSPRRVFRRSRWGFTNSRNWDGGSWPTSSVREIWSKGWPHWCFRQLLSRYHIRLQQHLHRPHLESLCRQLMSSPDNCNCHKGLLNQDVVVWGGVPGNHRHSNAQQLTCPTQRLICHQSRNGSHLNQQAVPPAYTVLSWL